MIFLQERKKEAEEKLESRSKLLVGIREGLDHLVETLVKLTRLTKYWYWEN